jgi:cytochrome P450
MTQQECEDECLFMMIAGSDTTASAMRFTMLNIISTPRVYEKLKAEISRAVRKGSVSDPITLAEAKLIPYLQVSCEHLGQFFDSELKIP